MAHPMTCGAALVSLLGQHGVDTVFGIPGVHTLELYRPLRGSGIRHVTPRHEQGAGFMADGYARASGRPGVCLLISGPGLTNAATPIAQAYSDSVPMLVISAVHRRRDLGLGRGFLHELPSQRGLMSEITAFSQTLLDAGALPEVLARAFAVFNGGRPRPVHIEIPMDVMAGPFEGPITARSTRSRPGADPAVIDQAATMLAGASRPAVLLGGGAVDASAAAMRVIEWLDAPAVLTNASKGVVPANHRLCVGSALRRAETQALLADSDVVLAVGTELGETDAWNDGRPLRLGTSLVRIDIDPQQIERMSAPCIGIVSDARLALDGLFASLQGKARATVRASGSDRSAATLRSLRPDWRTDAPGHAPILDALAAAIPGDAVVVADSAQINYTGAQTFPSMRPRSWLTSMTGFGTLGYGLPAAIGAKIAVGSRPVICITGDGGLLFTLSELAAAVEERLSLPIVIWNNAGYAEIGAYMDQAGIDRCGVDLHTPDFVTVAAGFGCRGVKVRAIPALAQGIRDAFAADVPTLIDVDARAIVGS